MTSQDCQRTNTPYRNGRQWLERPQKDLELRITFSTTVWVWFFQHLRDKASYCHQALYSCFRSKGHQQVHQTQPSIFRLDSNLHHQSLVCLPIWWLNSLNHQPILVWKDQLNHTFIPLKLILDWESCNAYFRTLWLIFLSLLRHNVRAFWNMLTFHFLLDPPT